MKKLVCTAVALAALLCAQPSQAGIGISPRLALPLGDFGDAVGTGFGLSVMMDNIKDKPIRGGLSFLTFGEGDLAHAESTAISSTLRILCLWTKRITTKAPQSSWPNCTNCASA